MAPEERDVPVSSDYAKSLANESKPTVNLKLNPKQLVGFAVGVVAIVGGLMAWSHVAGENAEAAAAANNPLASRPGFETLRRHVESLAEIDGKCAKQDRLSCYCELADRIRADRQAIDSLLANDPELKTFQISVRRPASAFISYDLTKLPKAPDEAECLNAVAAPTIIDDGATDADGSNEE